MSKIVSCVKRAYDINSYHTMHLIIIDVGIEKILSTSYLLGILLKIFLIQLK